MGRTIIDEIDLLVSDLIMPEVGGVELLRRLRAERPGLPCLFMTGYAPEDIADPLDDAHLIQKPFTPGELLQWIETILG